ncbi:hypothetical protein BB934_21520 [Microvirga ossetica]|uniref:Uncharacterized protein n=1 Tax=Microvirga ossetica TaxID=1882682 RepID=A0A1B2EKJ7_9HYPH|nr:hypothetical protein BB934_21520 [Microvirga ossetica]
MSAVERIAALVTSHREGGCLLPALDLVPEGIVDDAQMGHICSFPALQRVRARHALAGARVLDVRAAVPDQLADIKLIVEDARAALLLAPDGGVLPRAIVGTAYMLIIQPPGDCPRTHPVGEHREDTLDDDGLGRVDHPPSSFRVLDHVIAEGLAGRGAPLQDAAQLPALGLLAQVGEEHLRHRAEHADMHGGDRTDIDCVQAHAMELELVVQACDIRELAR